MTGNTFIEGERSMQKKWRLQALIILAGIVCLLVSVTLFYQHKIDGDYYWHMVDCLDMDEHYVTVADHKLYYRWVDAAGKCNKKEIGTIAPNQDGTYTVDCHKNFVFKVTPGVLGLTMSPDDQKRLNVPLNRLGVEFVRKLW